MFIASSETLKQAADHLLQDPVLAPTIKQTGLPTITPHHNYYSRLIESIISQQLSVKAAASIQQRFKALFDSPTPDPEALLQVSDEQLRAVGLSRAKINYIRDLARHIIEGVLQFDHFEELSNEEIIRELINVKGIGEWTAHMFLMFAMGRLDILAVGDLGIRNGIKKLYELPQLPLPAEVTRIAEQNHWHPYETAACWYIWHSFDNPPAIETT